VYDTKGEGFLVWPGSPILTLWRGYKEALIDWAVGGAVQLVGRAYDGLRATLVGVTEEDFKEALYRFVCHQNGEIDQVKEEREPWREQWEWHYDLRPTINGVKTYVETRLYPESWSSSAEPTVLVVQIKPV
jgi:hypothetical protein